MSEMMIKALEREDLEPCEMLILPMIVEELKQSKDWEEDGYINLVGYEDQTPLGVLIAEADPQGDLTLLSIWTDPECRRQGVATKLLQAMTQVALQLYQWEEHQYGDDVLLRVMYCLENKHLEVFEAWLRKNDFTDFYILDDDADDRPAIRSADAEIHFFRTFVMDEDEEEEEDEETREDE